MSIINGVCCWIQNQLMGYNCEAGSFSKKTYNNISGADCVSYSKTGCLFLNPQISNPQNLTVPLVSSKKSSVCQGQHLLLVVLIIVKDSSNLLGEMPGYYHRNSCTQSQKCLFVLLSWVCFKTWKLPANLYKHQCRPDLSTSSISSCWDDHSSTY